MSRTGREEQRTAPRKIGDPVSIAALSERSSDPARVARGESKDHSSRPLFAFFLKMARSDIPLSVRFSRTLPFSSPRISHENSAGESFRLLDTLSRVIFSVNH